MEENSKDKRPDLMVGKKILYVHGFGSSGATGSAKSLRILLPKATVISPDLPIRPAEAMELLHSICEDRYAALFIKYNMNGKLFNRIPLIKHLKWREMFCVRAMWGTLTDKNNPYKPGNEDLFVFPMRNDRPASFIMDSKKPYVEVSFGIYNIFKLFHVEYVRRYV